MSEGIMKKFISGTQWDTIWEVKDNRKPIIVKKIIVNLLSKLWYIGQILFQNKSKNNLKEYTISCETEKIPPPRQLDQLSIWMGGLDILDIETLLNSLKVK